MVHSSIPTLRMLRDKLGCKEKTEHGVCWYECNTSADKVAFIFHGVTGNKLDMIPLAERYVGFGYAVYLVDLPGHGGSIRPEHLLRFGRLVRRSYDASQSTAPSYYRNFIFIFHSLSCPERTIDTTSDKDNTGVPYAGCI